MYSYTWLQIEVSDRLQAPTTFIPRERERERERKRDRMQAGSESSGRFGPDRFMTSIEETRVYALRERVEYNQNNYF